MEEPTPVSHALSWQLDSHDGTTVVTVSGVVDAGSGAALYRSLTRCLDREPSAVVVDLSGASVTNPEAARGFAEILNVAQPWPGTPVLVCTPDSTTAAAINAATADEHPPVHATVAQALSALTTYKDMISEVLLPVSGAARRARDIVTGACVRWDVPELTAPATIVASELVTNAVMHAHTMMTLQMALRPRHLYLAVADGSPAEPLPRDERRLDVIGGRGLLLVNHAADRWGHRRQHDGKVVWARFSHHRRAQADDR